MKTLFYFQNENGTGFAVWQMSDSEVVLITLNADEMQKRVISSNIAKASNIDFPEIASSIFPIPASELIEMGKRVFSGADLWEEINIFEDLTYQEIAATENDNIVQNEYWQGQESLSWV
jgi:hypothetical protein